MTDQTPWSLDEQIAEVRRELALRKNVYPKMIKRGTIKKDKARVCYSRMQSVEKTLVTLSQFGRITLAEFDGSGPPQRIRVEHVGRLAWFKIDVVWDKQTGRWVKHRT